MTIQAHASTVENGMLGLGFGALFAFENAKQRNIARQRAVDAMDTFSAMKSELIYERSLNDALIKRIAQLEAEIQILEDQIDAE